MSDKGMFCTLLPWNFITKFHEGVVVQKDGIIQRTFAFRSPDLDSSDAHVIDALCLRVNDFTKRLGAGWAFHLEAQRFYAQEYDRSDFSYIGGHFDALSPYLIDREREKTFKAYGKHFESSYYLTFIYKPPSESVKKLTLMFIQSGQSNESEGAKSIRENVRFFVEETNTIIGVLQTGMLIAPLNNEETVAYLHSTISFNKHPISFPCTQILLDRILPDMQLLTSLTMKLGEYYIPIIGINDFPEETYPAILDSLNRAQVEYRWTSRYICLDKETGKKEAQKKEKAHRGNKKTFFQTFTESTSGEATQAVNHGASVKEGDAIQAGIEIDTDIASLGFLTTCVVVWDKDLKAAKKKADIVRNIINSAGFTCKEETFNALEAWESMMPGNIYANYRALPVMSNTLSHVVPLSSIWSGMRRNDHAEKISGVNIPHLICSTAEGTPFFMNINPSDVGHTAIWGPTGAGKSTFLNLLEMQFFKYPNAKVIVFDKGKSCRLPCLSVGGLFYEPASENYGGINFQPLRELLSERDLLNASDFIESLFTVNNYQVSPPMRAAIMESLELLREKPMHTRTLTSFVQYCSYVDPETKRDVIKELLGDYLIDGGKYGKIFDARCQSISLDTRFLAIEMEDLMNRGEGCVVPALVYLFNLVEKMFDGNLTMLVLDEAWLFLKNETFSAKIGEWLKVLRKKNVFVIFATQDVADVAASPLKTTITQQCLTKIFLADPSASTANMIDIYRSFDLSGAEISLISSATMKRDYYYTSILGRRLFQLDLGELTLGIIGGADHRALDNLVKNNIRGASLLKEVLDAKNIDWQQYLDFDAPSQVEFPSAELMQNKMSEPQLDTLDIIEETETTTTTSEAPQDAQTTQNTPSALFDALLAIPAGRKKSGKKGRAAEALAEQFSLSPATVYMAQALLKSGASDLIEAVKNGSMSIKTAHKKLKEKNNDKSNTE
ncbi:MAG: conjugal transfer protein TrbE [Termitinemataceae bacterium]|nr:MAG: conjugal transfer protein TrbE [Termitinemataceae bacterium]